MRIRVEIALKMMPPRYGGEAFVVVGSGGDHEQVCRSEVALGRYSY